MTITSIRDIQRLLIEENLVAPGDFRGCSEAQIQEIKQGQGVKSLPSHYHEFLSLMGIYAGMYLSADSCFYYPNVIRNKRDAQDMLQDNGSSLVLPEDAFVFYAHDQGYEFTFFHTYSESDNPFVYEYQEELSDFRVTRFTLLDYFEGHIERLKWLKRGRG